MNVLNKLSCISNFANGELRSAATANGQAGSGQSGLKSVAGDLALTQELTQA